MIMQKKVKQLFVTTFILTALVFVSVSGIVPIGGTKLLFSAGLIPENGIHSVLAPLGTGVCTLCHTGKNGSIGPVVQFSDDFSNGNMEGWSVMDETYNSGPSNWSIQNGKLIQLSNIYGPDAAARDNRKGTFAYWNDWAALDWTDYTFGVTLSSKDNDGIGVMFRYQDQWNYYKYVMDKQRNFHTLFKVVNGVETTLASVDKGYTQNVNMALQIDIYGNQISVQLDDNNVFGGPISDNDLTSGTIALYSWGNQGSIYDDVQVKKAYSLYLIVGNTLTPIPIPGNALTPIPIPGVTPIPIPGVTPIPIP